MFSSTSKSEASAGVQRESTDDRRDENSIGRWWYSRSSSSSSAKVGCASGADLGGCSTTEVEEEFRRMLIRPREEGVREGGEEGRERMEEVGRERMEEDGDEDREVG